MLFDALKIQGPPANDFLMNLESIIDFTFFSFFSFLVAGVWGLQWAPLCGLVVDRPRFWY